MENITSTRPSSWYREGKFRVIIPGDDDTHPRAVGENLHRILPHSELHPPLWSAEEAEKLRQHDSERFQDLGHERRASVYLPFLEKVEGARVSVP